MGDAIFSRGQLLANGRYRIERLLGEGGMGTVYQATELNLERTVALKVLLPELSQHPTARQRMEAEAKAMARIRSPHVVGINTISDEGGLLVIDLEYMSGGSLADRLDGRGVDEATAKDWITQILKGLEALHKAGLVHRDLKPANVLIDEHGALKVTDLGIAQDSQRSSGFKTRHDANLGTAEYMAPEQVQSAATVDARADVYAAGIMLYEFLVGHVPFQGEDWEVKAAQVRDTPDLTVVQRRSATLTHVLDTALAKEPERRFRTAGDMAKALVEPPESPARSSGNRSYTTASNNDMPERRPRFKMPMAAAVGAAVAVLAAGVGVWALQGGSEERAAQAEALEPDSAPTATTARLAGAGGPDSTGAAVAQINQADAAQTEPGTQPNTEQVRPLGQGALGDTGATSSKMVVPEKRFAGGRGSRALTTEHKTAPSVTSTPGGCDKGDITRSVRARAATLRACYETQLVDKPDLSGRVTVQWTITGDGSVTGEKIIDDTLKNQAVTDCVLRAISQIKFIKPETGVCVLQWPFVFNPA